MAIKYTKDFNAQIRKDVRHFNQVRKTLLKRGIKLTPAPIKVSELKARYQTRGELKKELTLLRKISSRDDNLTKEIETSGGARAINWDFQYLKANQKQAIEFFEHERELELSKNPVYPHEKMRLNEIESALEILNLNLNYLNQEQFKGFQSYIKEYFTTITHMQNGYKGFLWQVENTMRLTGYSQKDINSLFSKLKTLNPSEFHDLYTTNNLIDRIYELVTSPPHGERKLTTTEDDAHEMIEALLDEIDQDIAEVKSK